MSSIRDKIRASTDLSAENYEIPEWGVTVEVRSMTARARAEFVGRMGGGGAESLQTAEGVQSIWWHIILTACFDPDTGDPVFSEADADWLFDEKSAKVVEALADRCLAASGLSETAQADAGKDSSASPTDEAG